MSEHTNEAVHTEDTETQEHPQQAAETPQEDVEATEDSPSTPEQEARREAAGYRRRLRETETELDQARQQLAEAQWRQVGSHLSRFQSVEPLQKLGYDIGDFTGDDGHIDQQRVQAVCQDAAKVLGIARQPVDGIDKQIPTKTEDKVTWEQALRESLK